MLALRTTGGGPMELRGASPIGHRITRTTTMANNISEQSTGCLLACGMMMMGHIHSFVSINHSKGSKFHFQQYTFLLYDCYLICAHIHIQCQIVHEGLKLKKQVLMLTWDYAINATDTLS